MEEKEIKIEEQALEALKIKKLFDQYFFSSEISISLLKFVECKEA